MTSISLKSSEKHFLPIPLFALRFASVWPFDADSSLCSLFLLLLLLHSLASRLDNSREPSPRWHSGGGHVATPRSSPLSGEHFARTLRSPATAAPSLLRSPDIKHRPVPSRKLYTLPVRINTYSYYELRSSLPPLPRRLLASRSRATAHLVAVAFAACCSLVADQAGWQCSTKRRAAPELFSAFPPSPPVCRTQRFHRRCVSAAPPLCGALPSLLPSPRARLVAESPSSSGSS